MCGISNYGVLMLFMVSLYFYNKTGRKYLILAGLFEAICIFSSGNGLICGLCLVIFTLLSREKLKSIASTSIFFIGIPLYFFHYQKMTTTGSISDTFNTIRDVRFFCHMLGNHFSFENGVITGICELILLIVLMPTNSKLILKLKFKPETIPFISILCLVIGTCLSIAVFRSNDKSGELASNWSRYLIYPHILAALLFLFLWIKIAGEKPAWYLTIIAYVIFLMNTYTTNSKFGEQMLAVSQSRLENYPYYYLLRTPKNVKEAKTITSEACRLGIYCIEEEHKITLTEVISSTDIQICPVEANGSFKINFSVSPYKYRVNLSDATGKDIEKREVDASEKDTQLSFKLKTGDYHLRVQNNTRNWQRPITVK